MSELSPLELQRYAQHLKLPELGEIGQEKLKSASVLCVGLGGLGSPLLLYLAAAGVGRLGLVDDDKIELSNLQRQVLYRTSQVSQFKTEAAAEALLALNPEIEVQAYCQRLDEQNAAALISQYDIVADCSDNFYTNYLLHDLCFKQNKPYMYASANQFQGYCSLFVGQEGPCFRCLFPTPPDPRFSPNCDTAGVLGVLPGLLGTLQAAEIIKWVLGILPNLTKRLLRVDLLQMSFKDLQMAQNPDCDLCVHHKPLEALSYPMKICASFEHYAIDAPAMFELLKMDKVSLVDVRTAAEYAAKNMGGVLLPLAELADRLDALNPEHTLILVCQSGKRSLIALNMLLEAGFSSLRYLRGGLQQFLSFT